jgi:hypothetical protein
VTSAGSDGDLADGIASALGLAVPGVGEIAQGHLAKLIRKSFGELTSGRRVIRAVERSTGMSYEDVVEAIEEDPRLQPVALRVLVAAVQTGHHKTLDALGATFGIALAERPRLDEVELMLIAIKELTAQHFALLETLASPPPPEQSADEASQWHGVNLAQWLGWTQGLVYMVLPGLFSAGLVETPPSIGFSGFRFFRPSEMGSVMLDVLARLAD